MVSCGRKHVAKGFCDMHYRRERRSVAAARGRGRPPASVADDFAAALRFLGDGTGYREAARTTGVPYSTLRDRYPGLGLDSSQGGSIGVSILRSRVVGLRG